MAKTAVGVVVKTGKSAAGVHTGVNSQWPSIKSFAKATAADGSIRQRKGTILLPTYVQQCTGLFGDFPRDRVNFKLRKSRSVLASSPSRSSA
jgi:hypothetical protein